MADHDALPATDEAQRKPPLAALILERPVARDVLGSGGEALDLYPPLPPMCARDGADTNPLVRHAHRNSPFGDPADQALPEAAPAASSASLARACACAFGVDLLGVSRSAGFSTSPASPRKRATRSLGCAPTPSQCLMRSSFKVIRSAWPRSSIGLYVARFSMQRPSRGRREWATTIE